MCGDSVAVLGKEIALITYVVMLLFAVCSEAYLDCYPTEKNPEFAILFKTEMQLVWGWMDGSMKMSADDTCVFFLLGRNIIKA